jgi:Mrp family chromosome partitioning ATPase
MTPLPAVTPARPDPPQGRPDGRATVASQLARTLAELEVRLEEQRALLRALEAVDDPLAEAANRPACSYVDCPRMRAYRNLLLDAIQVLEETRRSFKSRQLEGLRRRLAAALLDA